MIPPLHRLPHHAGRPLVHRQGSTFDTDCRINLRHYAAKRSSHAALAHGGGCDTQDFAAWCRSMVVPTDSVLRARLGQFACPCGGLRKLRVQQMGPVTYVFLEAARVLDGSCQPHLTSAVDRRGPNRGVFVDVVRRVGAALGMVIAVSAAMFAGPVGQPAALAGTGEPAAAVSGVHLASSARVSPRKNHHRKKSRAGNQAQSNTKSSGSSPAALTFNIALHVLLVGTLLLFFVFLIRLVFEADDRYDRLMRGLAMLIGTMIGLGAQVSGDGFATFIVKSLTTTRSAGVGATLLGTVVPAGVGIVVGYFFTRALDRTPEIGVRFLVLISMLCIIAFAEIYVQATQTKGVFLGAAALPNVCFMVGLGLTVLGRYGREGRVKKPRRRGGAAASKLRGNS
jgi:hypothetical protein